MKTRLLKLLLLLTFVVLSCSDIIAQFNWMKDTLHNPVLHAGPTGSWYSHVLMPSVLYNEDSSRYEMWFGASSAVSGGRPYQIGYSFSYDKINWSTPILVLTPTAGSWDSFTVEYPCVIRENGEYKMWYSGGSVYNPEKIGYATSPDGIEWTKSNNQNPVFEAGMDPWENNGVMSSFVMPSGNSYKMWYVGYTWSGGGIFCIGFAESTDGITWQRDLNNNPVLEPGTPGQWDDKWIYNPRLLFIDNLYYMWYAGDNGAIRQIGLATSSNGITNWEKHWKNPVLSPSPGKWDGNHIICGSVIFEDSSLYMWYDGNSISNPGGTFPWQIGLATSVPFIPVPVELISFTSSSNGNEVILNWSTATELNNHGFEVQRRTDYTNFFTVGFVNGNGTTTEKHNYSFTDKYLINGKTYYRLKQVDYDGSFEFSKVIEVEWRAFDNYLLEQNYPNPFNPSTTIGYGIKEKSNVKIIVLNAIGEEVATILNEEKDSGYHTVEFNSGMLTSGVYFYKIAAGGYTAVKKMLLIK